MLIFNAEYIKVSFFRLNCILLIEMRLETKIAVEINLCDLSQPPEHAGYYEILVGSVADFIVRGTCEIDARSVLDAHCEENPILGIRPADHLDLFLARPLDPDEAVSHHKISLFTPVSLQRFYETNPPVADTTSSSVSVKQGKLFNPDSPHLETLPVSL